MENNSGVVNSGQITATNFAVGEGASINNTTGPGEENIKQISAMLDQLLHLLQNSPEPVNNKKDIEQAIGTLKEEVHKPSPAKLTIKSIGSGILDSLKYATTLAPLAEELWRNLSKFFA